MAPDKNVTRIWIISLSKKKKKTKHQNFHVCLFAQWEPQLRKTFLGKMSGVLAQNRKQGKIVREGLESFKLKALVGTHR